ncbi:MAG: RHS repeat protein, partial [Anaerolineae bacterium]|nr:RHS repeat protein [Anaerolineae bacterium]
MDRRRLLHVIVDVLIILSLISWTAFPALAYAFTAPTANTPTTDTRLPPSDSDWQPQAAPPSPFGGEPVYVMNAGQIGRTFDLGATTPTWHNITPPNVGALTDFALDPFHPDTRAWAIGSAGIWRTETLDQATPTWSLAISWADLEVRYDALTGQGSNCDLTMLQRLVPDPAVSGRVMAFMSVQNSNRAACPVFQVTSTDYGMSWTDSALPAAYVDWVICGLGWCDFLRYHARFQGAVTIGASGRMYLIQYAGKTCGEINGLGTCSLMIFRSDDRGATWYEVTAPAPNGNRQFLPDGSSQPKSMYISRRNPDQMFSILERVPGSASWPNQLLSTSVGGTSASVGTLAGVEPSSIRGTLNGHLDPGGQEHIFALSQEGPPRLFESTDGGATWAAITTFPADRASYIVDRATSRSILTVRPACAGTGCSSVSVAPALSFFDGNVWLDKTGNWYAASAFDGRWVGGDAVLTTPVLARPQPGISAGAVAGDDWDKATMRANTAYHTQPLIGRPVNSATGHYLYSSTDLSIHGRGQSLTFHRTYSTMRIRWAPETMGGEPAPGGQPIGNGITAGKEVPLLGPGWTHNYNVRLFRAENYQIKGTNGAVLQTMPVAILFQEANGSVQVFEQKSSGDGYVFDPEPGLLASLVYNESDHEYTLVLFPDKTRYTFNNDGRLVRIDRVPNQNGDAVLDRNGNAEVPLWNPIYLIYNERGHLYRVTDSESYNDNNDEDENYLEFAYQIEGDIAEGRDRLIEVCDHRRGASLDLSGARACQGSADSPSVKLQYTGDVVDVLALAKDVRGYDWTYAYRDHTALLTAVRDPAAQVVERQVFEAAGEAQCATTALWQCRVREQFQSNDESRTIVSLEYLADEVRVYDRPASVPAREPVLTYAFDNGVLRSTTAHVTTHGERQSYTTRVEWNSDFYQVLRIVDAKGNVVSQLYELNGVRLQSVRRGNQPPTTWSYMAAYPDASAFVDDRVREVRNPRSEPTTYDYDDRDFYWLPTTITDALGNETRLDYWRGTGLLKSETQLLGGVEITTFYCYDPQGRRTHTVQNYVGDGESCDVSYIAPDTNLITEALEFDGAGRPTRTRDPQGRDTKLDYDRAGNLIRVIVNYTDGGAYHLSNPDHNLTTTYRYDGVGRLTDVVEWRVSGHLPTVNPQPFPQSAQFPNSAQNDAVRITRIEYDALGQVTRVVRNFQIGTDGAHNVTAPDKNIETFYAYDLAGNQISVRTLAGRNGDQARWRTDLTCYDTLQRPLTRVLNADASAANNPANAFQPNCNYPRPSYSAPDQDLIIEYSYDELGNVVEVSDAAGAVTRTCYDGQNRPLLQVVNPSGNVPTGPTCVYNITGTEPDKDIRTYFEYDEVGNLVYTRNALDQETRMCYDGLNRLRARVINPSSVVLTSSSGACVSFDDISASADPTPDRDILSSFEYDTLGRMIRSDELLDNSNATVRQRSTLFTFDAVGRLTGQYINFIDPGARASRTIYRHM